jgi:hypothetical protein
VVESKSGDFRIAEETPPTRRTQVMQYAILSRSRDQPIFNQVARAVTSPQICEADDQRDFLHFLRLFWYLHRRHQAVGTYTILYTIRYKSKLFRPRTCRLRVLSTQLTDTNFCGRNMDFQLKFSVHNQPITILSSKCAYLLDAQCATESSRKLGYLSV